jgi:predicted amidohydrolase YtcJ
VVGEDDLDRIARLGVVPVPQGPLRQRARRRDGGGARPERVLQCYRQRSFLDAGIPLPGSSDRPVVQGRPLLGIADLVLRRTAERRRVRPDEASRRCRRCTPGRSARRYAAFEEHRKGSLVPGKLADLAVLSDDLTAVDPEQIASLQVLATVVGGEVRHDVGLG